MATGKNNLAGNHEVTSGPKAYRRSTPPRQLPTLLAQGLPLHLIAHEDVLVFRTSLRRSAGSGILMKRQDSRRFFPRRARHAGNPRGGSGVSESISTLSRSSGEISPTRLSRCRL